VEIELNRFLILVALVGFCALECRQNERPKRSFGQICQLVEGKTAADVEKLLGPPDIRETVLIDDERWIWWDYTYLDGQDFAPRFRGQVVHLQITFNNPSSRGPRQPYSRWRIASRHGVSYSGLELPTAPASENSGEAVKRVRPSLF
jgi:hypothetical protein